MYLIVLYLLLEFVLFIFQIGICIFFFVSLSSKIVARVQIKNLSKYFVKNWQELFQAGKLVKGKILR